MDWNTLFYDEHEKPLDRLVSGYSRTAIFRKIAFIGDSLSSGEFETRNASGKTGYHDMYDYSWGQYIARKNGLTAYNFSRGGMTAKWYVESYASEMGFFDRDKAAQAYVLALGINDVNQIEIGEIADAEPNSQKESFVRYYAEIVRRYKEISPEAKFFFLTLAKHDNKNRPKHGKELSEAIRALADYFGAYLIDLETYGPCYDDAFKKRFYLHWHLNADGYILTAELVDSYIDYIVRHHPEDFQNVPFIGTGILH